MNKLIIILLALVVSGYGVNAQTGPVAQLLTVNAIGSDAGAVRATRDFYERAGDQKDEKWYRLSKGYLAYYEDVHGQSRFIYDQHGSWVYSVQTYDGNQLPESVKNQIKTEYPNFSITWAKEINERETTIYVAHMENKREWLEVTVQDGELRASKAYDK